MLESLFTTTFGEVCQYLICHLIVGSIGTAGAAVIVLSMVAFSLQWVRASFF